MAVQPASEVEERIGEFEHSTPGHLIEDAIVEEWEATGLPVERATVEEDEKQGYDVLLGNLKIDLTTDKDKFDREIKGLEELRKRVGEIVPGSEVIPVKVSMRDWERIRTDPTMRQKAAVEALRGVFRTLETLYSKPVAQQYAQLLYSRVAKQR